MDLLRTNPVSSSISTNTSPGAGRRRLLTAQLNAEWESLVADPAIARQLAMAPIAGHHDLASLLAACHGRPDPIETTARQPAGPRPRDRVADDEADDAHGSSGGAEEVADAVMAQVVGAGLEGRTLAIRTALQRVLGPLVAISVRRTRHYRLAQRGPLFDELCATAWLVIGTYPLARRPRCIAANICRDTEYQTCVRAGRLHQTTRRVDLLEEHHPSVGLRGDGHSHSADDLADLLLSLHGSAGLGDSDLALLHALAAGVSTPTIAQQLGCTDRTIRNRRSRLLTVVRNLSEV